MIGRLNLNDREQARAAIRALDEMYIEDLIKGHPSWADWEVFRELVRASAEFGSPARVFDDDMELIADIRRELQNAARGC